MFAAELFDGLDPFSHFPGDLLRVVDDDAIALLRRFTQGRADKLMQLLQVGGGAAWPGHDEREGDVLVIRVHEDAEEIQQLLGCARAAGEDDDAVADADEGLQALLDVRQDHQLIDDRVGRFGGDDPGFG